MLTNNDKVVALLDADSIAVIAATTNEAVDDIVDACAYLIRKWTELAHADTCRVFVSEGKNFRYDVYDNYKHNRKDLPPIPGRKEAVEFLRDTYPQDNLHSDPRLEADDRLGYYATEDQDEEVRVIVSIDKDLEQIPTWVMNPNKWRFPVRITPEQAFKSQMKQWLVGDSVDGYPGIKGFGPKKFEKWWNNEDSHLPHLIEGNARYLYDPEETLEYQTAYEQYLCATIKHHHLPEYAKCLSVEDLEQVKRCILI